METDQHLWNLLRCAASNRLVDRLRRHSDELAHQAPQDADVSEEERLESAGAAAQPGPERDALLWGADHRGWRLVELLFRHEERFHVRFRLVTDRHPRQFRALVLYELGALLHREVNTPAATPAGRRQECSLMRRYAALLGIPPADWARVEQAAVAEEEDPGDGALIPGLRDAVNALCDTSVRTRTGLTTLRYELKRILKSPPARALEWK